MRLRLFIAGLAALAATASIHSPGQAAALGDIRSAGGATAVASSYIVVLKDGTAVEEQAQRLAGEHGGTVVRVYTSALHGFEVTLTEQSARQLAADPAVDFVEQNHTVSAADTQANPSWGLDRVDQAALPLSKGYTFPNIGAGVHAYVLDTGIRSTHKEFGGRVSPGLDAIGGSTTEDCNGHGTHVAGILGGASYGVAKGVELVAVRVLDCSANGTFAQLIAGVDWVTANAVKPAVANISLNGGTNSSVNAAVANSIASGVVYSVAASNQGDDACTRSPASATEAITVGATEVNDARAPYSNFGTCLDLFAPGTDIPSAGQASDTATATRSGTSQAAPYVGGAAAVLLSQHPDWSPAQIRDSLVASATPDVVTEAGEGSPNRLLRLDNSGTTPAPKLMPFQVPKEVLDTRDGTGGVTGKRGPGTTTTFPVLGIQHIPSTGVKALVVRITAHTPTAATFLTVWPDGTPRPTTLSMINVAADETISNIAVVTPGANGRLAVYNNAGDANIIVDVQGYFTTTTGNEGGGYVPVDHTRLIDTRSALGTTKAQIPADGSRTVTLTGSTVPAGATGVFVNLIVPGATANGWINASTVNKAVFNYTTGSTQSAAMLDLPPNGKVTFYNKGSKPIDLVVIVQGYLKPDSPAGFHPVAKRLLNTRTAGTGVPLGPNERIEVQVTGTAGIPATGVTGLVLNVTATPVKAGSLNVWPFGVPMPSVTAMDFNASDWRANVVVVAPGDGGRILIRNGSTGDAHLIVDVQGWFGAP